MVALTNTINNKEMKLPDPNNIHPITGYDKEINIKPTRNNNSTIQQQ